MKKMSFAEAMWAMTERGCRVKKNGSPYLMAVDERGNLYTHKCTGECVSYGVFANASSLTGTWRIMKADRTQEIKRELRDMRALARKHSQKRDELRHVELRSMSELGLISDAELDELRAICEKLRPPF